MEIDRIIEGDCLEELPKIDDNSIDAIVTDPPAAINFMQKSWDSDKGGRTQWIAWMSKVAAECLRVIKPGGHALVWALPRTSHWTGMAWEEAGWEPRDKIAHVFGCLSDDTEILIDGAWSHYRKCDIGCLTLCYNNETDSYSWQPIQEVFEYRIKDTAYRIQSDLTDQIVTRNHRCLIEREGKLLFCLAEEAVQGNQIRVPVLESLRNLQCDISLQEPLSGRKEQNLLQKVQCPDDKQRENRETGRIYGSEDHGTLCSLRETGITPGEGTCADQSKCLLLSLQRNSSGRGVEEARSQRQSGLVGRNQEKLCSEDNRAGKSFLEGRCDLLQNARKLSGREICSMPSEISINGPERRLCDGAPLNSCTCNKAMPEEVRGCASYQPRSDRQPLRESSAIQNQPGPQEIRGAGITRTTLARIEPIEYDGIVWCVRVPTGAFVARRNGKIFVTGNSGFPKSLDIGKQIDKRGGNPQLTTIIGNAIKSAREARGLSQKQCDDKYCGGTTNWSWFEGRPAGQRIPPSNIFVLIASDWPELKSLQEAVEEAEREVIGKAGYTAPTELYQIGESKEGTRTDIDITAPATSAAKQWSGFGTSLKPAHEDWWLFRKPLACKTIAENVLEWGCGGLNIDGCRIEVIDRAQYEFNHAGRSRGDISRTKNLYSGYNYEKENPSQIGRFPANLIWSHSPLCKRIGSKKVKGNAHYSYNPTNDGVYKLGLGQLDDLGNPLAGADGMETVESWDCAPDCPSWEFAKAGERKSGDRKVTKNGQRDDAIKFLASTQTLHDFKGDTGSASRFFKSCQFTEEDIPAFAYVAKASRSEREKGLDGMPEMVRNITEGHGRGAMNTSKGDGTGIRENKPCHNQHPTVKPLELMKYLVRLATPPNGIILDPFAGSGTTLLAAKQEGFRFIGIEKDAEYHKIACKRIAAIPRKLTDF